MRKLGEWRYMLLSAIIFIVFIALIVYDSTRKASTETAEVDHAPAVLENVEVERNEIQFDKEGKAIPTEQDDSGESTSGEKVAK